jgi:HTH-type transcriptional regulator/antitoxin HigA
MEIKPIKNDADYQAVLEEIERLFAAAPDTPEGDRLEVLTTLVEAYEERHYSIPLPDPVEAILYHMESRGLSRRDIETYIGSRARVSEVLNRRRPLTVEMIRNLNKGLNIPAEVLIQPYHTFKDAA